jgi:hypothetical protein
MTYEPGKVCESKTMNFKQMLSLKSNNYYHVTLEKNMYVTTIHCDLVIETHDEKMDKEIILVVKHMFLTTVFGQRITKILRLTTKMISLCIFLPWVVRAKSKQIVAIDKFPSSIWAPSNTRLGALDQCTSSSLIGGKGGAGPSSLHTMLEGPTEYVNARWM